MCELGDAYFASGQLKHASEWYLQGGASKERVITGTTSFRASSEEATSFHLKFKLLASPNDQGIPETEPDVSPASINRHGSSISNNSIDRQGPNMPDDPGISVRHPIVVTPVDSSLGQLPPNIDRFDHVGIQRQQCDQFAYSMGLPMYQPARRHMRDQVDRGGLNMPQQVLPNHVFPAPNRSSYQRLNVEWGEVITPSNWEQISNDIHHSPDSSFVPSQDSIDRHARAFRNKQTAMKRLRAVYNELDLIRKTNQDID